MQELEIPYFLTPEYQRTENLLRVIKRQQRISERERKRARIKGRMVTAWWTMFVVAAIAIVILIH